MSVDRILGAPALAFLYLVTFVILSGLTLVVVTLLVEILAARRAVRRMGDAPPSAPAWPRVAVLIPAHNESVGIIPTLADVKSQLRPTDRLLVVADNCSDDTAEVARAEGAAVFERQDPQRRGKGYALSAGVAHLSADPPDIVVMVDADCRLSANAIPRLAAKCAQSRRPTQANYVMRAPAGATLSYDVAEFAWRVKNFARPLGLMVLGSPCHLTGSGMAFPWRTISAAKLASGNIVEDMALGVELALRAEPPLFCPEAEVSSTFPTSNKALETQRRRWEQGHLQTIFRSAAPLILSGLSNRRLDRVALGLDLAIPPLTALVFLIAAALVLCLMLPWFGLSAAPLYVATADAALLLLALIVAWAGHGKDLLPIGALPRLAPYLMSQLRIYQSILKTKGAAQWTPTDRK